MLSIMSGRNYRSVASIGRRFLSTTSGTAETDSIRDFMKKLAENRKSEGADAAPTLWEKLGKTVAETQSTVQPTRSSNYPSGGNYSNNNRSFDRNSGGRGGGNSFGGSGRGGGRGGGSFGGRGRGGDGGFGGDRGGFNGGGGRGGGRGGGGRGGMVGGRGYNNRTGGGAPAGRTSSFGRSFDRDGGGGGGRGGRGGGRGTAGRGAGNARRGSGGMRRFGSHEEGEDRYDPEERFTRVKSKGGSSEVWEEVENEEGDYGDGDYYDEDGNYHGKNGEIQPGKAMDMDENQLEGGEGYDGDEDDEELFGVPDPIDGIVYFAKGSLPDHKNEKLDEVDRSNLYDSETFADEMGGVMDAGYIDTRGFDPLDTMLANTFVEAYKSPDDTVMEAVEMPRRKRVQLPTPRSLVQLYNYTQPPVLQNSKPDDAGVALAQQAWGVIHQNFYYSDPEKYQMVEGIATLHRKMLREIAKEQNKAGGVDLIFQPQFRKGAMYEAEEERLKALTNIAPKEDRTYHQADTDWTVQAVLDEDQL